MAAAFNVVLLTAAPAGQAIESGGAYVRVDGRETLLRCVELFLNRDEIKQITLVINEEEYEEVKDRHGLHLGFSGVKLVQGGPRWTDQVAAAGASIHAEATHVIVHDAARPAVPHSDIEALEAEALKYKAVALSTPVRTPLVELDEKHQPTAYRLSDRVMHILTPMVFTKEAFLEYAKTKVEIPATEMRFIKGSPLNVRVAGPGDAALVKAMLALLPKKKVDRFGAFEEAKW